MLVTAFYNTRSKHRLLMKLYRRKSTVEELFLFFLYEGVRLRRKWVRKLNERVPQPGYVE